MKYHIWSFEHDAWWCPNHRGYTKHIGAAGYYDEKEAFDIVQDANYLFNRGSKPMPNEALVPAPIR